MALMEKKVIFYLEDEGVARSVSISIYRKILPDGHTIFSIVVNVDEKDYFVLDHRSLTVLRQKIESILPTALLSRHHKVSGNLNINL